MILEWRDVIAALTAWRSTNAHVGDDAVRDSTEVTEEQKARREQHQIAAQEEIEMMGSES